MSSAEEQKMSTAEQLPPQSTPPQPQQSSGSSLSFDSSMSSDDEDSSTFRAKEEEIEKKKMEAMEVWERVLSQLGSFEEETRRLATIHEEIAPATEEIVQAPEAIAPTLEETIQATEEVIRGLEENVHSPVPALVDIIPALVEMVQAMEEVIHVLEETAHSPDEEIVPAYEDVVPDREEIVQGTGEIVPAHEDVVPAREAHEDVVPAREAHEDVVPAREEIVEATEETVPALEEIVQARDEDADHDYILPLTDATVVNIPDEEIDEDEIVPAPEDIIPALSEIVQASDEEIDEDEIVPVPNEIVPAPEDIIPALSEIVPASDEDTDHDSIPPLLDDDSVVDIPDEAAPTQAAPARAVSTTRFFSDMTLSIVIGILTGLLVGYQLNITASVVSSPVFLNWLSTSLFSEATRSSRTSLCRLWLFALRAFAVTSHFSAMLTIASITISTLVWSRVSPRALLAVGSVFHMAGSLLVMLSPSSSFLVLGVFLQGIGVAAALQVLELHRRDMVSAQKVLMKTYHDFATAIGPALGNGIHFWLASRGDRHAWKISLSSSGMISLALLATCFCLKTDSRILQRASARQPWRRLRERVGWSQLIVATVRAIVTRSTDLSVVTYLLTTYFGSSTETTTMVISLLCLWDVFWKAAACRCRLRAAPFVIAAFVMSVMQVAIGASQRASPIKTPEPVRRIPLLPVAIMGAVYMAARGWLSSPSRWLRHLHAGEVSLASITIVQLIDVLVQLLFGWYSIPIICWLARRIFFVLAVQALLAAIFIAAAVPETSGADSGEQQREMLRTRHIWRFFLGQPAAR